MPVTDQDPGSTLVRLKKALQPEFVFPVPPVLRQAAAVPTVLLRVSVPEATLEPVFVVSALNEASVPPVPEKATIPNIKIVSRYFFSR